MTAPRRRERPILLLGADGQVGRALVPRLAPLGPLVSARRADADLECPDELRALVRRVRPRILVNAAAYTAVDAAEGDAARCGRINAAAPGVLAEEAARLGAPIVHYSTNYVFDGAQPEPYGEEATPAPLGVYGATKLEGEHAIVASNARHLILRTAGVYDVTGRNFVCRMLERARTSEELQVVDDQFVSPTPAWLVAEATVAALRDPEDLAGGGIFHLTTTGAASWHAFTLRILALDPQRASQRVRTVRPVATAAYPLPAARPRNGVLSVAKFEGRVGMSLPSWETALARTICGTGVGS